MASDLHHSIPHRTLDGIIDTVSAQHELGPLLDLLKTGGKLIMLGASPVPPALPIFSLLFRRLTVCLDDGCCNSQGHFYKGIQDCARSRASAPRWDGWLLVCRGKV
jgi:threonine dehydrogenase-like Zn-dependent dehydrogenase